MHDDAFLGATCRQKDEGHFEDRWIERETSVIQSSSPEWNHTKSSANVEKSQSGDLNCSQDIKGLCRNYSQHVSYVPFFFF